ncbi:hypothetical protein FZEAL_1388 [Fusarium zealandicum]|uniref:RING-type E3 ubiquitin transferase n=1 Tax=Fusarium zealandicum TaxID=1053134 RepID=A0A8H4XNR4_9HYPO|nr:hypothetical protein FZEAL_1388 [Fusarium zealandicum]
MSMNLPTMPSAGSMATFLSVLACTLPAVLAQDSVETFAEASDVPDWATASAMQLSLSTRPGLQFTVVPLTQIMGLNDSKSAEIVRINGSMIPADPSNYNTINNKSDVAYLSCDEPKDDSFIHPNKMLMDLMQSRPKIKAIVLYSTSQTWCSFSYAGELDYHSILSMADGGEAIQALNYLNHTKRGESVEVTIFGNTTFDSINPGEDESKRHPAVAMSILYSITGLITLLFLVIIGTGAVRAHRYPERYGPRGALGGRPRQSRAKGLARAVLDTVPIVKFGSQTQAKPDPNLELETGANDGTDAVTQRSASRLSEARRSDTSPVTGLENNAASVGAQATSSPEGADQDDDHLGCSICTEDFTVGEDVRVLPCKHQFHPACVDPWLINVSGTCPLCRYDLRPGKGHASQEHTAGDADALPPPLALEGAENDVPNASHRNRLSRIFDINRLREGTVEEQMEALRRMRAEADQAEHQEAAAADGESRGQSARFAAKLRDRFRIRTQAQAGEAHDSQR